MDNTLGVPTTTTTLPSNSTTTMFTTTPLVNTTITTPTTTSSLVFNSTMTTELANLTTTLLTTVTEHLTTMLTSTQTTQTDPQTTTQKDDCNKLYLLAGLVTGAATMAAICITGYCMYRMARRCISDRNASNEQRVNQTVVLSNNNNVLDRRNPDQDLIII